MKSIKTQTLQEQIEIIIKVNRKTKPVNQDDLQYMDFNKSIENMLTAKPEDNRSTENILSL